MRKEQRIAEIGLFGACRPDELRWIARVADQVEVPAGTRLIRSGAQAREFIVVLDGLAVSDDGEVFGRGAHIGEIELIGDDAHGCSVEALTDVRLLVFGAAQFRGLLERAPSVSRKIMRELVDRLDVPNEVVVERPLTSPRRSDVARLSA